MQRISRKAFPLFQFTVSHNIVYNILYDIVYDMYIWAELSITCLYWTVWRWQLPPCVTQGNVLFALLHMMKWTEHIEPTLIGEFRFILCSFGRMRQCDLWYRISWPTISYINLRYRISTYDIVYHDLQYRISTYYIVYQPTISYINLRYRISTYNIVYQPTISYINLRYRISTYDIVYHDLR